MALVFRCADAGPASNVIFGQSFTSIIEVSIWGHVIDTGVLATVDHAVGTLQVPLILVLGHQNCAAMHTALKVWNDGQDLPQSATRAAVEQATTSILHRASGAVSADLLEAGHVVEAGLALLQKSPVLARAVDTGRSAVICALTEDSDNGRVRVCATIGDVDDQTQDLLECV
ncbi:carbonic anhydrase [Mycobacterium sp.]|uniref:carbonic anhydrase n=1 Tax=Mycobacterium sp. TaxID=1785 RepID=UPI0031D269FF